MNSPQENDPYREDRTALLRYYNSQCMTHAGYFISMLLGLVLALSTLLSESQKIAKVILVIPKFIVIPVATIGFGILIAILLLGCVYALYGIFYWGYLATAVIYLPVTKLSETKKKLSKEEKTVPTHMLVLHRASHERVKEYHPRIVKVKNIPYCLIMWFSGKKICPYCKTENKRNSIFCVKCGKKISEDRQL